MKQHSRRMRRTGFNERKKKYSNTTDTKVHNITQESNKLAENLRNRKKVSDG